MTFTHFIKTFRSMWGGAAAAAAAGPVILWVSELDPPWPPNNATKVTTLFCAVALILAYVSSRTLKQVAGQTVSRRELIKKKSPYIIGSAFLMIGLIFGIAYLWIYSKVVVTDTIHLQSRTVVIRKVVGTDTKAAIAANATSNIELLQNALYDEEKVWTADSLLNARMSLLTTFIFTFFSLTFGTALLASVSADESGKPKAF
ncbi:MAG TPA: hypothetical protein VKF36_18020 [Syntrophorhabdales bacterium]|nr:hypothetical protein [Syntrophorhabdales bacterium]